MVTLYDFDPRSQPKEILEAIGLVVLEGNELEAMVKVGLAKVTKASDYAGYVAFQAMPFGQAYDLLRLLVEVELDQSTSESAHRKKSLLDALAGAKAAMEERNSVVHAFRYVDIQSGVSLANRMKIGKSGMSVPQEVLPATARAVADLIRERRHMLFAALMDHDLH